MRELMDRLREAETALDNQLHELYYITPTSKRMRAIELLWKAKRHLWYAMMDALNAAAGAQPSGLDK